MRDLSLITRGEDGNCPRTEGYLLMPCGMQGISYVFRMDTPEGDVLRIRASTVDGWEHVGVQADYGRCPSWDEMNAVKLLLFGPDEMVVQFHPPAADYINEHPGMLHLWRHISIPFPAPPKEIV